MPIRVNIEVGTRTLQFVLLFLLTVAVFVFHLLGRVDASTFQFALACLSGYGVGYGVSRAYERRGAVPGGLPHDERGSY